MPLNAVLGGHLGLQMNGNVRMVEDPALQTGIQRLRTIRKRALLLWAGAIPVFGALGFLRVPEGLFGALAIGWFATWCVTVLQHGLAACPACNRRFRIKGLYGNAFTSKCMHCGLAI